MAKTGPKEESSLGHASTFNEERFERGVEKTLMPLPRDTSKNSWWTGNGGTILKMIKPAQNILERSIMCFLYYTLINAIFGNFAL